MVTKKIKDRTVKDIIEALLGKKNAKNVLTKIQKVYDDGVRGKVFQDFVKSTIGEIHDLKTESVNVAISVITLSIPTHGLNP
jgi:hypothetical protein